MFIWPGQSRAKLITTHHWKRSCYTFWKLCLFCGPGLPSQLLFSLGCHSHPGVSKAWQLWCSLPLMPTKRGPPFLWGLYPGCPGRHDSAAEPCFTHTSLPMQSALGSQMTSVKEELGISIACLKAFWGCGVGFYALSRIPGLSSTFCKL